MNALIVHAHENPKSFCSTLAYTAKETLESIGYQVIISDLYAMGFDPVGSKKDFKSLSESGYYKYPLEQLNATQHSLYSDEVQKEIDKLLEADLLIFNFPLWWYSMPAMLKGWVDKVMAYGVAYGAGTEGRFNGRQGMVTITTGSPKKDSDDIDTPRILENVTSGIIKYVGYDLIPSFVAYGVSRVSQEEREQLIEDYKSHLSQFVKQC